MRAFRRILDRGNHASIHGVIGQMKFVTPGVSYWVTSLSMEILLRLSSLTSRGESVL